MLVPDSWNYQNQRAFFAIFKFNIMFSELFTWWTMCKMIVLDIVLFRARCMCIRVLLLQGPGENGTLDHNSIHGSPLEKF